MYYDITKQYKAYYQAHFLGEGRVTSLECMNEYYARTKPKRDISPKNGLS